MMQFTPSIPVEVVENDLGIPIGKGRAIVLLDYSVEDHLLWLVFMDESKEPWLVPNPFLRAQSNPSRGRP